jgi:hypothetical protein
MEARVSKSFKVLGVRARANASSTSVVLGGRGFIALTLLALVLAACGGGSSTTNLHGTFTDTSQTLAPNSGTCADQESGSQVSVAVSVDNVAAGSANVTFGSGKPFDSGIITLGTGAKFYSCTGTWQITVPSAKIGYSVSVGGLSGHATVSLSQADSSIRLNNGTAGTNVYEGTVQPNT